MKVIVVYEHDTSKKISNATVNIDGVTGKTDSNGECELTVTHGAHYIFVDAGTMYETGHRNVNVNADDMVFTFELSI